MDIDKKALLLMGENISTHEITIKNYTIGEIFRDIGLTKYLQMSSVATRKVRDYISPEYMEKFKDVTVFDIFCMTQEMNDMFIDFLNFFTGYEWRFVYNDMFVEFYAKNENDKNVHINRNNIEDVFEVIKVTYCLREVECEEIHYKDDNAKKAFEEFEEWEDTLPKPKNKITINSIILGMAAKKVITFNEVFDLKMYQLMQLYTFVNKKDNHNYTMMGIYSGNVDSKKIKLDEIHWSSDEE